MRREEKEENYIVERGELKNEAKRKSGRHSESEDGTERTKHIPVDNKREKRHTHKEKNRRKSEINGNYTSDKKRRNFR